MNILDLIDARIVVPALAATAGALVSLILSKFLAKTVVFRYSVRTERMAMSADDAVFGSVRVSWHDTVVRNLYLVSIEIENPSTRDFENVPINVYTDGSTMLMTERTAVVGQPYIVKWSDEFSRALVVAPGGSPDQGQWDRYNRSREYTVPIFNRGQLLELNYLCTRPNDDLEPSVFLSTQLKGATLALRVRSHFVLGVPIQASLPRGLIVGLAAVVASAFLLQQAWVAGLIGFVIGLFAQLVGAMGYRAERWLRRVVAG
jgi:hypothetical protein